MTAAGDIIAQRYRIETQLGEGGMGAVFRATHLELGRTVAVKLVRSEDPSEQALERFLREAKSAASVRHRNVVDVLDFGREGAGDLARPYLVMECLVGESLEARLRRAPAPSVDEVVAWMSGALSGLAAIHDAGIVHRDLKPANVFLAEDADGVVPKVLDFGIARQAQEASALTHTMQTLGTPHYMSPEQVRSAKTVDARTDIYSMGVILYLAFTGRLPFDGPSATAVIAAIVTEDPPPALELKPDLPPAIARVVHQAMARDPKKRFADARALRQALIDAKAGIAPGVSLDRPSFTHAPTEAFGSSGIESAPQATPAARARTGRRGFFAMLGVLSTLLVAGLAGSFAVRTSGPGDDARGPVESAPVAAAVPTTPSTGMPRGAVPGGTAVAPPPPAESLVEATSSVLSGPGGLAEVALPARSLSAADLAGVSVALSGEQAWLLGPSALSPRLGAPTGEPVPADAERFALSVMQTTVRANVRSGPGEDEPLLATLLAYTVVVALGPTSTEANDGNRGAWTEVVVADGLRGFIASSLLAAHAGCVPETASLPSSATWIAHADVEHAGTETPALVLFEPAAGGSVRIARVDALCRMETLADLTLPTGRIAEVFLTRTVEGGETLIGVGRWPTRTSIPDDGLMTWTIHRLDAPADVVLSLDLASGQNLPDARRDGIVGPIEEHGAFYPLRVRSRRSRTFYVWDGARLVPRAPDERRVGD